MADEAFGLLTKDTIRNLTDKLYEKRKAAAMDVEVLVRELVAARDRDRINQLLMYMERLAASDGANARKGGLIGLAALAIGLGVEARGYVPRLLAPVLQCFGDQDSRVRYYACESMYNITKVARGSILVMFNDVFDCICKLSADNDSNVKNGATLVDRLLKDVVQEVDGFDLERFMPLLRERIAAKNPFVRQFLLGWLSVLNAVPDINLLARLPDILDGVFRMLAEPNSAEIRQAAAVTLAEFLRELQTTRRGEFASLANIVVRHCDAADAATRHTALMWLAALVQLGGASLLGLVSRAILVVLPALACPADEIRAAAASANAALQELVRSSGADCDLAPVLSAATLQLVSTQVPTRLAGLQWLLVLQTTLPQQVFASMNELFPALLKTLCDPSEDVVRVDLRLLALLSRSDRPFFDRFMSALVNLFSTDRRLLEARGTLIVRHLVDALDAETVYRAFARILAQETDTEFGAVMVQCLCLILLTTPELRPLRDLIYGGSAHGRVLFEELYRAWCIAPVSALALCLLAQAYDHALGLVSIFHETEITVSTLMQIDKLVLLLESPVFTFLRLRLLQPHRCRSLIQTLYGILMLLPQSTAFDTLARRLRAVGPLAQVLMLPPPGDEPESPPLSELLLHFRAVQARVRAAAAAAATAAAAAALSAATGAGAALSTMASSAVTSPAAPGLTSSPGAVSSPGPTPSTPTAAAPASGFASAPPPSALMPGASVAPSTAADAAAGVR